MDKVFVVLKVCHEKGLTHVIGAFDTCRGARHEAYQAYRKICEEEFGQEPLPEDPNKNIYYAQDKQTKYAFYVTGLEMTRNEEYPIKFVSREDLDSEGFDTRDVTDDDMERLAIKLGDAYGSDYFIDLPIIADALEIPHKSYGEDLTSMIRSLFDGFVSENGHQPKYADCAARYLDDSGSIDVIIKLLDDLDAKDDRIFFYCGGINDFINLCDEGHEDFVVTDIHGFCDEI